MRIVIVCLLTLVATQQAYSGWGGGGCAVAQTGGFFAPQPMLPVAPTYEWRDSMLFRDGIQIGAVNSKGVYWKWENGQWRVGVPPVVVPEQARPDPPNPKSCDCSKCDNCKCEKQRQCEIMNYGIDTDQLKGGSCVNGVKCEASEAKAALGAAIADISSQPYVTAIGNDEDIKRIRAGLDKLTATCRVRTFRPDDWAVSSLNYVKTGKPTVYLQAADGTVLARDDTGDLRKIDPSYDPSKDGSAKVQDQLFAWLQANWVLVAGVLGFFAWRKGYLDNFFNKGGSNNAQPKQ